MCSCSSTHSGKTRLVGGSEAVHELVCDGCGSVVKRVGQTRLQEPQILARGGVVIDPPKLATNGCVPAP